MLARYQHAFSVLTFVFWAYNIDKIPAVIIMGDKNYDIRFLWDSVGIRINFSIRAGRIATIGKRKMKKNSLFTSCGFRSLQQDKNMTKRLGEWT